MIRSILFKKACSMSQVRTYAMTATATATNQCKSQLFPRTTSPAAAALVPSSYCNKRQFTSTRPMFNEEKKKTKETVSITYFDAKDDTSKTVEAEIGMDLMNVAHDNNIELEGACGGELACSTCHLIFQKDIYNMLPEMEEEEEDMLDLAFEVTETSRLGCQILVKKEFDGMTVTIPDDGF